MHITEDCARNYLRDLAKEMHKKFFHNGNVTPGISLTDVAQFLLIQPIFNWDSKAPNWTPEKAVANEDLTAEGPQPVVDIYMHNFRAHQVSQGASYILRAYAYMYLRGIVMEEVLRQRMERDFDDLARFGSPESFREALFTHGLFGYHRNYDVPLGHIMAYAAKTLESFGLATLHYMFRQTTPVKIFDGHCFCGTESESDLMHTFLGGAPVDLLRVPHYRATHDSWNVKRSGAQAGFLCATSYVVAVGHSKAMSNSEISIQRTIVGASCRPEYAPLFD